MIRDLIMWFLPCVTSFRSEPVDRARVQPEAAAGTARALVDQHDLRPLWAPVPERRGRSRTLCPRRDRVGRLTAIELFQLALPGVDLDPLSPTVFNTLREWRLACPKGEFDLVFPNKFLPGPPAAP
jgi:hypothetical protein